MSAWLRLVVVVGMLSCVTNALAATQDQIESARARGLAWLILNQNGDGSWQTSSGLGVQSTAATIEAMLNSSISKGKVFGAAVTWLKNADAPSVDSLSRKIVALSRAGTNATTDLDRLMTYRNSLAAWGAYDKYYTSYPDTALAVSATRAAAYYYYGSVSTQVQELGNTLWGNILPGQLANGSWMFASQGGVSPSQMVGAIMPTAYNVMELQAAHNVYGWDVFTGSGYKLTTSITNGVNWLLSKKYSDKGFGDSGQSSVLETALAYQALDAVGSNDPAKGGALDYLISQQDAATGSWGNDPFQTAMVLKTFPPVPQATPLKDTDNDGIPDVVEAILGTNSLVADGRAGIKGNGQGLSGVTTSLITAIGYLGQTFTKVLTTNGGTAPYSYAITSGGPPDGLVLASDGTISGTPTVVGTFNFSCLVTDSAGLTDTVASQIPIRLPGDCDGNGVVSVDEVQSALNMLSGAKPAESCVDMNGDGVVSLDEATAVQRANLGQ